MSERGFEHSRHKPSTGHERLIAANAVTMPPEAIGVFILDCYTKGDIEVLDELIRLLYEKVSELDDDDTPDREGELRDAIYYAEMTRVGLQTEFDILMQHIEAMPSESDAV